MRQVSVSSGIGGLDEILESLRLGDNVVWQIDDLSSYVFFVEPFVERALADGRACVYLRFAPHPPVLAPRPGLEVVELDPGKGFDYFSREVHETIEERGKEVFYVFDNLSALVVEWATDELLANFFQITCPFLFELDTVAYFAVIRGRHSNTAIARIRDTTQVLIDVFQVDSQMYIHPLKVWDRYSPQMFLPHIVTGTEWPAVFQSGDAAAVSATASKFPLRGTGGSIAPWDSIYNRLAVYRQPGAEFDEAAPEVKALKNELCRMIFGHRQEFDGLVEEMFSLEDLFQIRERVVGSGMVGGKAGGMLLARRILALEAETGGPDFSDILEDHDSFYIGSDVFFTFLVENDLFRLRMELTSDSRLDYEEFEEVEQRFLAGKFNPTIMEQFRNMLDYFGQAPIIVRSSSLLEDSFGNAFAGKYRSEFCPSQGSPEDRMAEFLRAVKLVYASTLNPGALSYRRKRGLGESDEQMAILVMRVSGMPYKHFFFPFLAGVAFSRNLYAWTSRIDPAKGIIRLVFGLGTRAVDRVAKDYPRMIAVSNPGLRPEAGEEIASYSQHRIDLLDLDENSFRRLPISDLVGDLDYPDLYLLISSMSEGYVKDPAGKYLDGSPRDYVFTFNNLIGRTDFVKMMGAMLERLESALGYPVDIEFTASIRPDNQVRINLLQCRALRVPGTSSPVSIPEDIPAQRVLFRAQKTISGGIIRGIRYIVYIDPQAYSSIPTMEIKKSIGRLVGRINEHPLVAAGKAMMMGPGRWGSSNISLGVNVTYSDIDNAAVLVEMAREEAGHVPEVSYGTHFFQDLVEAQVVYLPVYPGDPDAVYNEEFFENSPNSLLDLLPDAGDFVDYVHLIDVQASTGGACAQLIADPQTQRAVCFLDR